MCGDSGGGQQSAEANRLYQIQGDIAQDMFKTWKETYLPVEREAIADVRRLSDPTYVDQQAGMAQQDVSGQFTRAREVADRQLAGLGVDPGAGGYESRNRDFAINEAIARAGAGNVMRDNLRREALQGKMSLSQTGRGLANMGMAGIGQAAGGFAGLANANQAANAQRSAGYGQAIGTGLGLWGANGFAGLGGAGAAAGPYAGFTGVSTAAGAGIGGYSAAAGAAGMTEAEMLAAGLIAL